MKSLRFFATIALTILLLALMTYESISALTNFSWSGQSNDMVEKWDERIQPLRQALPPDTTHVGYINSFSVNSETRFDAEEFYLMQYSIAPVVIESGINQRWIIGNFDKDTKFRVWLNTKIKKYEVQSFGAGLYLIHRLDK